MEKDTTYVGLDDSKRKIVAGILRPGDAQPELRELVNDPQHIRRLFERLKREGPVMACYEAGVSGYDLHRQITALGVTCAVIAPALTPRRPGQRVKTDRRDAAKLAPLFRAGELGAIHVPDESEEAVRDLVRCRNDVCRNVLRWRHRSVLLVTMAVRCARPRAEVALPARGVGAGAAELSPPGTWQGTCEHRRGRGRHRRRGTTPACAAGGSSWASPCQLERRPS
jgi:transposase